MRSFLIFSLPSVKWKYYTIEFSLNESWLIPKIVWFQRGSISDNKYIFLKAEIPPLSLVWYLFNVVTDNRHLTRDSNGNPLSITATGNVFVTREALPLITRPVLDFVMVHWILLIQWKPFRENSTNHKGQWQITYRFLVMKWVTFVVKLKYNNCSFVTAEIEQEVRPEVIHQVMTRNLSYASCPKFHQC